jgi:hypothetical protein
MIKNLFITIMTLFLASCNMFEVAPQPFPVWTAIPSRTPVVVTSTPIILVPLTSTPTPVMITSTPIPIINTVTSTETATLVPFTNTPMQSVQVEILGCNTSIDIVHGMGEVTNAYVTVKNTGTVDLPNMCSLLRSIDEDREHPDKKVCIPNLPAQNQITLKLTVDSTYKQDTVIQVDTLSNEVLLLRVDKASCRDIGLFGGTPTDVNAIKPVQQ